MALFWIGSLFLFPCFSATVFFASPSRASPHAHAVTFCQRLMGTPMKIYELFLKTALCSPVHCPQNSSHLRLRHLLSLSPRFIKPLCFVWVFPPDHSLDVAYRQKPGVTVGLVLLFVISHGSQSCTAYHVLSENHCFMYFVQLSCCLRWEGNSHSGYLLYSFNSWSGICCMCMLEFTNPFFSSSLCS